MPNVYAPGLAAAGAEVCLGSVSAGGAGAGFGVSIGGTYVDQECQLRLNARTLATLGYTVAAREEMCIDSGVRAAMLRLARRAPRIWRPRRALQRAGFVLFSAPPVQEASAQGCERRYQLLAVGMKSANNEGPRCVDCDRWMDSAPAATSGRHKGYQLFGGWYDGCK